MYKKSQQGSKSCFKNPPIFIITQTEGKIRPNSGLFNGICTPRLICAAPRVMLKETCDDETIIPDQTIHKVSSLEEETEYSSNF